VSSSSTALRVSRWHQETTRATQQVIGHRQADGFSQLFPAFSGWEVMWLIWPFRLARLLLDSIWRSKTWSDTCASNRAGPVIDLTRRQRKMQLLRWTAQVSRSKLQRLQVTQVWIQDYTSKYIESTWVYDKFKVPFTWVYSTAWKCHICISASWHVFHISYVAFYLWLTPAWSNDISGTSCDLSGIFKLEIEL